MSEAVLSSDLRFEQMVKKGGAFLTVRDGDRLNTMTIAWGSVGFIWNRPLFTAAVSPARYTASLLDNALEFTVSIPQDDRFKEALALCGSKSGRDLDKFAAAGLQTLASRSGIATPVIAGPHWHFECRVFYRQPMLAEGVVNPEFVEKFYGIRNLPLHVVYYGEILAEYETKV